MSQYGSMVGLADLVKVLVTAKDDKEAEGMAKFLGYEKKKDDEEDVITIDRKEESEKGGRCDILR